MRPAALLSALFCAGVAMVARAEPTSCRGPVSERPGAAEARLTERLLRDALRYAREQAHPVTGFVRDTVPNYDAADAAPTPRRASISSTGFMMALEAVLYTKGLVPRAEAYAYCRRPIDAVLAHEQADRVRAAERARTGAPDPQTDLRFRGWFAHFIDWETGDRWPGSEYAVTDSTWFVAGAMVCARAFPESPLSRIVDRSIYAEVDFVAMMTDGGAQPNKRTLALSYSPAPTAAAKGPAPRHPGYSPLEWHIYQHSWLAYLLGLGSPNPAHRLPALSWAAWDRTGTVLDGPDPDLAGQALYGDRRALFSHYFPAVFMPPDQIEEACGIDYLANSELAARFNQASAAADSSSSTFQAGVWGLDAGPNPAPSVPSSKGAVPLAVGAASTVKYQVNTPYKRNGTACPACAVAAAMFTPDLVFDSLRSWCQDDRMADLIWGRYGPANGISLERGWVAPWALSGIIGPMALSVANVDRRTSVWRLFASHPAIARALLRARLAPAPAHGCLVSEEGRPVVDDNPHEARQPN
jgi:hypothetical protein